jgi:cytochrome P450
MGRTFPPGPRGKPLIGSALDFIRAPIPFMVEVGSYGGIGHFRLGPLNCFLVSDPDYIHTVLIENAEDFHRDFISRRAARKFIGNGLVGTDGEPHHKQRKLLAPAFNHKRLETYATIMLEETERMLAEWDKTDHVVLDKDMPALTLRIVCRCLLNADVSTETEASAKAMEDFQHVLAVETREFMAVPDWLPLRRKRLLKKSVGTLNRIITQIIEERRKTNEDKGDLLSTLLMAVDDENKQMSNQQVHDEAVTLFITGHETTASTLSWIPYLLVKHPEVAKKLYEEIDTALGGRTPTLHDLHNMPYLEQVIKETLRLYPPGWIFGRSPLTDVKIGPYTVKRGDIIFLSPFVTHRDPRYFEDAEAFIPERFTPEFEKQIPKFAYFPFGGGVHFCLGQQFAMMEAKLVLAAILPKYRLYLTKMEDIQPVGLATLRPDKEIRLSLESRTHNAYDRQAVPVMV